MKILIIANHDLVIYNFRKELVERLVKEKHEVIITCPNGKRIGELIHMGATFIETKMSRHGTNPLSDYRLYKSYKKIIKENKPNVVLTYTIKPNIYGGMAAKKYKIPYIANITGLGTAVENKGILQKITIFLYKRAFKRIKTVFFQNKENMDFFAKYEIATKKYQLLPGSGVNLSQFKVLKYPKEDITRFAFIGRIMKDKGISELLYASNKMKNLYKEKIEFYLAGMFDGGYETIVNDYHQKGIINYVGMVDDVSNFLTDKHCVVLPSYHEGMANVMLEAQASGRPVIGTDVSGVRETMVPNLSGFLVKSKNQEDLFYKLEKFYKLSRDVQEHMGYLGRQHVETNFNRDSIVDIYIRKIEEIKNESIQTNSR